MIFLIYYILLGMYRYIHMYVCISMYMYVCMYVQLTSGNTIEEKDSLSLATINGQHMPREVRGLMSSFLFPGQNIEKPDLVQVLLPLGHDCSGHVIYRK